MAGVLVASKAAVPMVSVPAPFTKTSFRAVQPWKALLPTLVTPSPMMTRVILSLRNAQGAVVWPPVVCS